LIPSAFNEIDFALNDLVIDSEEQKEMAYVIAQSKKISRRGKLTCCVRSIKMKPD
jgi:hypothetical protein